MDKQQTSVHGDESTFSRGLTVKKFSDMLVEMESKSREIKSLVELNPQGKFGVIFTELEGFELSNEAISKIASVMKEKSQDQVEKSSIPLAMAFFAQFIDHDLTFDTTSSFDERVDPLALENFRTPFMDLDCLYGTNPEVDRYLYDTYGGNASPGSEHRRPFRLLVTDEEISVDLPRNSQGTALIGDPRNDENLFISQLHRKFIGFHNEVVKYLEDKNAGNPLGNKALYEKAREEVTLHYHWIIKKEFLPLMIGKDMVADIIENGFKAYKLDGQNPFIPVEFAGAVYRFGHTLIPSTYNLNDEVQGIDLFHVPFFGIGPINDAEYKDYRGVPKKYNLDWSYFLDRADGHVQFCSKVDSRLSDPLFNLPFIDAQQNPPVSLPERNMKRGRTLGLPSGQRIAEKMGLTPLTNDELGLSGIEGLNNEAPLWYYILKESEIQSGVNGNHLGNVGGRIVGEVLLGIIESTQKLMFASEEERVNWKPKFGSVHGEFTLNDLINYKFVKQ